MFTSLALPAHAQPPAIPPVNLIRTAIQNELKDDSEPHYFVWTERKFHGHSTQTQRLVQTPSGIVSRVILIDGKPLDPEQQRDEEERIRTMLDPEQMRQKQKEQQEDDARTRKLLSAIPDAFNFVYLDSVTAANGHKLITFKFSPRPGFNPPSREVAVFTAMRGTVVLDETVMRLTKVDGTLFKDVNFGWGILGRLYKGGRFLVEKSEITPGHWDTSRMMLHFDGRILLFKSLHIEDNETDWDYQPVPPMTVEQALDYLKRPASSKDTGLGS